MNRDPIRPEIVESFTFRANGREVTIEDAVIDTGATRTEVTEAIVKTLELDTIRDGLVTFGGESAASAAVHRCVVAWTIYESQGFWSEQEVHCLPGMTEVLIGFDFLSRHELSVDTHYHGLVGHAPRSAQPLTGGGYTINAPRRWILERNRERCDLAKPGEVLRPHPAWRFTVPALVKQ